MTLEHFKTEFSTGLECSPESKNIRFVGIRECFRIKDSCNFGTRTDAASLSKVDSDEIPLLDTEISYKNMSTLHRCVVFAIFNFRLFEIKS